MTTTRRQLMAVVLWSAALLIGTEARAVAQEVHLPLQWNFNERTLNEHETVRTHEDWEQGVILPAGMTQVRVDGNLSTTLRRDPATFIEGGFERKWPDGVWRRFFFFTFQGGPDVFNPETGQFEVRSQPHIEIADSISLALIAGTEVRGYITALNPGRVAWKARIE